MGGSGAANTADEGDGAGGCIPHGEEGSGPASGLLDGGGGGGGGATSTSAVRAGDVFPGPATDVALVLLRTWDASHCGITAVAIEVSQDLLAVGTADGWVHVQCLSTGARAWSQPPACMDPEIGPALLGTRRWVGAAGAPGVRRDPESEWRRHAAVQLSKALRDAALIRGAAAAAAAAGGAGSAADGGAAGLGVGDGGDSAAAGLLPGSGAVRSLAFAAGGSLVACT